MLLDYYDSAGLGAVFYDLICGVDADFYAGLVNQADAFWSSGAAPSATGDIPPELPSFTAVA